MDGVTQKFNVFDFFNLIIAGTTFLIAVGYCHYIQAIEFIQASTEFASDSTIISIFIVVLFLQVSFIFGATIQVIEHWITKTKITWESKAIGECLNGKGIYKNQCRTDILRRKACAYLGKPSSCKKLNSDETTTFFAYCIYYLNINGLDAKTEKIRETQSLSSLLACAFGLAIICSMIIFAFGPEVQSEVYSFRKTFGTYLVYMLLCIIFWLRYILSGTNRIRMVLSIYDAHTTSIVIAP